MVVRGVPERLAKDAWWLADKDRPALAGRLPGVFLLVTVALADWLIWDVAAGLGLVIWFLALAAAAQSMLGITGLRRTVAAWGVLVLALIPLVDVAQALSIVFALIGLLAFASIMTLGVWDVPVLLQAMLRFPGAGGSRPDQNRQMRSEKACVDGQDLYARR